MAAMAVEMQTLGFEQQVETLAGLGLTDDDAFFRTALAGAQPPQPVERIGPVLGPQPAHLAGDRLVR